MNFKFALVREPGKSYRNCITSHPLRKTINFAEAKKQHANYCQVLEEIGLELIKLPILNEFPDSCFIEDSAIIHNNKAFICRMGALSRRGEEISVESKLKELMEVKNAKNPATIEGGDVIHLDNQFISGITQRTNREGVIQLNKAFNIKVDTIVDPKIVHLKSYVTYLGNDTIITTKKYLHCPIFDKFNKIAVEKKEEYAANTLTVNGTILIAEGYKNTESSIKEAGFDVITLKTSTFQLCEGALTCLSLLF